MLRIENIHIIGCGGTGSWLIDPLLKLITYHQHFSTPPIIHLYDGDYYEESNSSRQLFPPSYIGRNKAVITKKRIADQYSHLKIIAYPKYLDKSWSMDLNNCIGDDLVIVAIDNTHGRNDIIKALDESDKNFLCVLPGNEFRTATCAWYLRLDDKILPCHPFDMYDNYANPTDKPRGNCAYQVVSSPQLITANFASALLIMETIYNYLSGIPLPMFVRYDGGEMSMTPNGIPTVYL